MTLYSEPTERNNRPRRRWEPPRTLTAFAVLGAGLGALLGLYPGGMNDPDPVTVVDGPSVAGYRFAVEWIADAPAWVPGMMHPASEAVLLMLGGLAVAAWWTGRRRGSTAVAGVLLTGLGTVVAYLCSEAFKLVADQERPCRVVPDLPLVPECPAVGDWSFPSNHATLAGALVVGLALAWPRIATLAVPIGVVAAGLRVLAGVHYPHDVLAGFVLGGTVTAAMLLTATMTVARLVAALTRVRILRPLLSAEVSPPVPPQPG